MRVAMRRGLGFGLGLLERREGGEENIEGVGEDGIVVTIGEREVCFEVEVLGDEVVERLVVVTIFAGDGNTLSCLELEIEICKECNPTSRKTREKRNKEK